LIDVEIWAKLYRKSFDKKDLHNRYSRTNRSYAVSGSEYRLRPMLGPFTMLP
jgi:hypothetical protein